MIDEKRHPSTRQAKKTFKAPQAQAKTPAPGHGDRLKGEEVSGLSGSEAEDARLIVAVGEGLFGHHWQAEFARAVAMSKSSISRITNRQRGVGPALRQGMYDLVLRRIAQLAALLDNPGMPGAGTRSMDRALRHFEQGLKLLKTPPS